MEIWKKYNEDLTVSNYGNVIAKDYFYYHINRWGTMTKQLRKGGLIEPYINSGGYLQFNYKNECYLIHQLVAATFIPNPKNYEVVNHKDENTLNNNVGNLEWCTNQYNLNYGTSRERAVKHTRKRVDQIDMVTGEVIKTWDSIKDAAEYGFNRSCISLCCNGKLKKHKGYIWKRPL